MFLLLVTGPAWAQAPAWQSAIMVGTVQTVGNSSRVTATATDASGNVYVAGSFGGTVRFGSTTLTSIMGSLDVFVAKWSPTTNQFLWAQRAGGTNSALATALAVSGISVYVAGDFSGTASFGSTSLTSAGNYDVFVAKLMDAGSTASFTWAQRAGGMSSDEASALAVSGTSVYVAGRFWSSTASFGSTSLTSAGHYDPFVAKLTDAGSTGSFTWAERAGGAGDDAATTLAVSSTSVYVVGSSYSATTSFGTMTLVNPTGTYFDFLATLTDPLLTATVPALAGAGVDLYPNPAHATATLVFPASLGTAEATLTLADALGRVVRTQALAGATAGWRCALDLRGLAPGVYALRVQAGAGAAVRRLVVE